MMVKMEFYCADKTAGTRFGINKFSSLSLYF
jgi:hypothetical protein